MSATQPLRIGIGGPVGSGKTALTLALCRALRERYDIAVVTNDIYTEEDAQFLVRNEALAPERIIGVETGGCPHTAIREDASINLEAVARLMRRFERLELVIIESGGDNLAATFSPELSDLTLYVIDVAAGDKIPRKGGPGITKSDLLVINKIDLAPLVGASLEVMARDAKKMRGERPFVFSNLKTGPGPRRNHPIHRNRGHVMYRFLIALLIAGLSTPALAHPFHGAAAAGAAAGFVHPFMGLDHLVTMLAVGIWAAQLGARARWIVPGAFLAAMLAGARWVSTAWCRRSPSRWSPPRGWCSGC